MVCPGTGYEASGIPGMTSLWDLVLVNSWGGQAGHGYYSVCYDRLWLLWPREEDRPRAGSSSLSQREVSMDELACEPSQVLAGPRPCPWDWLLQIRGSCSRGTLPDKGLHLHDSAPDCHHLRLSTVAAVGSEEDLAACWGLDAQVKPSAFPDALPTCYRVSCCFTGHHRRSWSGLRCLGSPLSFFAPGILASVIQIAAASRSSILAGIQPGHP